MNKELDYLEALIETLAIQEKCFGDSSQLHLNMIVWAKKVKLLIEKE